MPGKKVQTAAKTAETAGSVLPTQVERVAQVLCADESLDFSCYKDATLARRIERRMLLAGHPSFEAYIEALATSCEQRAELRRDLLINVTRFFRDPAAWVALRERILPELIACTAPSEPMRLWVTACSTGEDAYTLAMLVTEAMEACGKRLPVKIFATDIASANVDLAVEGVYPGSIVGDVSSERLTRFFSSRGDSFCVDRQLREMVVFAPHDLTKDAPFRGMQLVLCRNVLIYMQASLQLRVLSNLHHSLCARGVLFLGAAEHLGKLDGEFDILEPRWKLFRKRREALTAISHEDPSPKELPVPRPTLRARERSPAVGLPVIRRAVESLLDRVRGACLLVGEDNRLIYTLGHADRYLRVPEGRQTTDVAKLVSPDLALTLTTAIRRARTCLAPISYRAVPIETLGGPSSVAIDATYHPADRHCPPFVSIYLHESKQHEQPLHQETFHAEEATQQRMHELEQELQRTKHGLEATIVRLETSNEQQLSTNTELMTSNEELQSTNEDLQSVNEELHSLNVDYQRRIRELVDRKNDLDHLLHCTGLGTIFLDAELRIRKFTSACRSLFHLAEHDVGRPITDLSHVLRYPQLEQDFRQGLAAGRDIERDVRAHDGRRILVRISPYRTPDETVSGIVVTLIDVSSLTRIENDPLPPELARRDPPRAESGDVSGSRMRVLIVDDSDRDRQVVEHCLKRDGGSYRVDAADSIASARTLLSAYEYDLVLLDHRLPDGNGLEFLREVRDRIPVIMLTGHGEETLGVKALQMQAYDYVVKDTPGEYALDLPKRVRSALFRINSERDLSHRLKALHEHSTH